eukprot:3253691-Rhodomonas_salina.6
MSSPVLLLSHGMLGTDAGYGDGLRACCHFCHEKNTRHTTNSQAYDPRIVFGETVTDRQDEPKRRPAEKDEDRKPSARKPDR